MRAQRVAIAVSMGTAIVFAVLSSFTASAFGQPTGPRSALQVERASLRDGSGQLHLRIRTLAPWTTEDLRADDGLCVYFWDWTAAQARSRVCAVSQNDTLALVQQRFEQGTPTSPYPLPGVVERLDDRTFIASFGAETADLRERVLFWQVRAKGAGRWPAEGRNTLDRRSRGRGLRAQYAVPTRADSRDAPASGLDVLAASVGQRDLRLVMLLRMSRAWRLRDLRDGRNICVDLTQSAGRRRSGRICLWWIGQRPTMTYTAASGNRSTGSPRPVPASVARPDGRSVRVTFPRRAVGLRIGRFRWSAETRWRSQARCGTTCTDRVPDVGTAGAKAELLAQPYCFAAAARDRAHPCSNQSLRSTVFPLPDAASVWPNGACRPGPRRSAVFAPCEFGLSRKNARSTFALIGDSHAVHWRAALEVVAQARRWRGVSITRAGCPFSTQIPNSPSLGPGACAQLHEETIAWLRAHPGVRTIFVSDWAQPPYGPQGGTSGYGGGASSFGAMLDAVPRTVRRIYVLRDIPGSTTTSMSCVDARLRAGLSLRNECATARSSVMTPDPGAAAAQARGPRAKVIDLTRFLCATARCYPVIGGAFVYKDDNHMNAVFSTSLGPYVLRAMGSQ